MKKAMSNDRYLPLRFTAVSTYIGFENLFPRSCKLHWLFCFRSIRYELYWNMIDIESTAPKTHHTSNSPPSSWPSSCFSKMIINKRVRSTPSGNEEQYSYYGPTTSSTSAGDTTSSTEAKPESNTLRPPAVCAPLVSLHHKANMALYTSRSNALTSFCAYLSVAFAFSLHFVDYSERHYTRTPSWKRFS